MLFAKSFHVALKQTDCLIIVGVLECPRPGISFLKLVGIDAKRIIATTLSFILTPQKLEP